MALLALAAATAFLAWEWAATRAKAPPAPGSAIGVLVGSLAGLMYVPLTPRPIAPLFLGVVGAGLLLAYALTARDLKAGWVWMTTLCFLAACAPSMILSEDVAVSQAWGPSGNHDLLDRLPHALWMFSLFPLGTGVTLVLWDRHPDRRDANRRMLVVGFVATTAMLLHALRPFVEGPR